MVCPFDSHPFKIELDIGPISSPTLTVPTLVCMDVTMMVLTISRNSSEKIIGILCWVFVLGKKRQDLVSDVHPYQGQIVSLFLGHMQLIYEI